MRYEENDDPKTPAPIDAGKKREGWPERGESRKDDDRDFHRHVRVQC